MRRRKHDRTEFHLQNPDFCDGRIPILKRPGRLALRRLHEVTANNAWTVLAQKANSRPEFPIVYFPDSNIAINDAAREFWARMRLLFLKRGIARVAFSAPIISELRDWILEPRRNEELARSIYQSLKSKGPEWAFSYNAEHSQPCRDAIYAYCLLLGFRRTLLDVLMANGNTSLAVAMNTLKKEFGERTQLIAKKGACRNSTCPYSPNDELHVLLALFYAIESGREVAIVTTDEDVLECFVKAHYMIDMHYRAMLSADLIFQNRWFAECQSWIPPEEAEFEGAVELYPHPSAALEEVLPSRFTPVDVSCVYIKPDESMVAMTITLETEMLRLFQTRAITNGLCTDKLGGRNVHLNLSPIDRGGYVGVGFDRQQCFFDSHLRYSYLDFAHVINSRERYAVQ